MEDHTFWRLPSNVIPNVEEMWDIKKEMGTVKSEKAKPLKEEEEDDSVTIQFRFESFP